MISEMPYVHIGIVVKNLQEAVARFTLLGLSFMEPRTVHVDRLVENAKEDELDLHISFSHQGPPHWELLEATGHGIYGPQHIGGLHHVAVLHPDPAQRSKELVAAGLRTSAMQLRDDDSMIAIYIEREELHGVRIELIDEKVQDTILSWIAGKDATA